MKELINGWIDRQLQLFCGGDCPINCLMEKASTREENQLLRKHCDNCVAHLFVEKITK
jgi:hypothetical protein